MMRCRCVAFVSLLSREVRQEVRLDPHWEPIAHCSHTHWRKRATRQTEQGFHRLPFQRRTERGAEHPNLCVHVIILLSGGRAPKYRTKGCTRY